MFPAVNSPLEEMVPPAADQVTAEFEVPVTVAENCCWSPVCTDADNGLIETVTVGGLAFGAKGPTEPPQPERCRIVSKPKARTAVNSHRRSFLLRNVEV
jgi:hypothetical protein